jgi:hypothetical protein
MATETITCPQCDAYVPRERLTCNKCGYELFKNGIGATPASNNGEGGLVLGCGLLIAACVIGLPLYLINKCSQPSAREKAEMAAEERQARIDEEERDRFERQQASLWSQNPATITREVLIREIEKCKSTGSPTGANAVYYSDYDTDDALRSIKSGIGVVEITGQQRHPMFNNVRVSTYKCYFEGIGFERLDVETIEYIDNFLIID